MTEPLKRRTHKMVKHTQTIGQLLPTNCLSEFDNFVGLALKGLTQYFPVFRNKHRNARALLRNCLTHLEYSFVAFYFTVCKYVAAK